MADHVEQIKQRLDVVDVISSYIKVQKSGVNFKARCPFHNEKSASFYISPERQIWHCFGCSKGGDMFGFVKEMEGVEFPEALRILASRAGVQLQEYNPTEKNEKTRIYSAVELATKFFEKQLYNSQQGKRAHKYLLDRGMTEETMKEFRLGFAPNDWQALGNFLADCGFSEAEAVSAGLSIKNERGRIYDRFRSRITFPIMDLNGQVVGFTARIFEPEKIADGKNSSEAAKYINTPQTLIYDKSRVLYGLARSKTEVRQADKCLLVEGNMDALMSYQAGVKNVVATSGTALTLEHLRILKRYTPNLDFCFDTDQAGALATRRAIGLALAQDLRVNVVQIKDSECKDPADYVKKYGAGWLDVVKEAKPAIEFYFDKARSSFDPTSADSKRAVIGLVAPLVKRLASRVEKSHWVSQLAMMLKTDEEAILADMEIVKDDIALYQGDQKPQSIAQKGEPKPILVREADMLNETLLSIVLKDPSLFVPHLAQMDMSAVDPAVVSILKSIMQSADVNAGQVNLDEMIRSVSSDNPYRLEFAYMRSQEMWKDFTGDDLVPQFDTLLAKMKKRDIMKQLAELELEVKKAESQKQFDKVGELVAQFSVLAQKLAEPQGV